MASNATQYNNLTPAKPLDKKTLNRMAFIKPAGIFQL